MAYDFVPNTDYYAIGSAVVTTYPFTLACWYYVDSLAATRTLLNLGNATGGGVFQRMALTSAAVLAATEGPSGTTVSASSTTAPTTGSWQHAAGVFTSSTDRAAFRNGTDKGTNASTGTFSTDINRTHIGARLRSGIISQGMDGRIAECCIWNAALTDAEVFSLGQGYRPTLIRPDAIVMYVPLVQDVLDFVGNNTLTATGSPTVIQHPRRIA